MTEDSKKEGLKEQSQKIFERVALPDINEKRRKWIIASFSDVYVRAEIMNGEPLPKVVEGRLETIGEGKYAIQRNSERDNVYVTSNEIARLEINIAPEDNPRYKVKIVDNKIIGIHALSGRDEEYDIIGFS